MEMRDINWIFFLLFIGVLLIVSTIVSIMISRPCDPMKEFDTESMIQVGHKCFYGCYEVNCTEGVEKNLSVITTSGNFDRFPIYKGDRKWIDILNEVEQ